MEFNLAPELSERNQEWMENVVRVISQAALTELRSRKRDQICYMYYNGLKKDEEFNYLNEVGDYIYPAKVRFLQIIRPKVDLQLSKLTRREINFATIASDSKSQKEKFDKKLHYYLDYFDQKIASAKHTMIEQVKQINQRLQEIDQIMNNPPQSQEDFELQQGLAQIKPELERLLVESRTQSENIVLLTESDEEKIDHYWKYSYKDVRELASQIYLKKAMTERDIPRKSVKAFKEQMVTGKPLYFVDTCPGEKYPTFEQIPALYTCWASSSPTGYVQDGTWATYTVPMGVAEVLSRFGHMIKAEDKKRLKDYQSYAREANIKTNFQHAAYFTDEGEKTYYSGTSVDKKVDVTYVYWRSPRKITRKFTPNPHVPGKHFSHVIDESEVLNLELKDDEFIEFKYIDDIYEGILIGSNKDGIVINARPKPNQVYDVDTFKTQLPIVGYTFGDMTDEPYSYIWATKDLQDLYNILMFQVELLVVLSGVKGIVMDEAQIPDTMSPSDWTYQRKMGVAWINTLKKKFGRLPTFNQFQQYDDTLGQSVLYILELARSIDEMAGMIIGVSRQAIGEVASTDQVGTNKMSIDQSALINEIQFWTHFDLLGKALTRFMNCAGEQDLIDDVITHVSGDLNTDDFVLPKDAFKDRRTDVIVTNTVKELDFIEDFKQIAINERKSGTIQLKDLIKVYQGNTLKEIESTLEYASKVAQEAQMAAQSAEAKAEFDKEAKLKEMDLKFKQLDAEMKAQAEQLKLQMQERENQLKANAMAVENDLKVQQQQFDQAMKVREFERDAIDKQNKSVSDNVKNRIDAVNKKIDLLLGSRKLDIESERNDIEREKVDVERDKVKKMNSNPNSN